MPSKEEFVLYFYGGKSCFFFFHKSGYERLISNYLISLRENKIGKNWLWKKEATWVEGHFAWLSWGQKVLVTFLEGPGGMDSQTGA